MRIDYTHRDLICHAIHPIVSVLEGHPALPRGLHGVVLGEKEEDGKGQVEVKWADGCSRHVEWVRREDIEIFGE